MQRNKKFLLTALVALLSTCAFAADVVAADQTMAQLAEAFRQDATRDSATTSLLAQGEASVPTLVTLLDTQEQAITRVSAATALWKLRSQAKAAIPALESTLESDQDIVLRMRAAQALLGIAGPSHAQAVEFLETLSTRTDLMDWIPADARAILKDAGASP
jgi:HEAT repeat protein